MPIKGIIMPLMPRHYRTFNTKGLLIPRHVFVEYYCLILSILLIEEHFKSLFAIIPERVFLISSISLELQLF